MNDVFVRCIDLPASIKGVTVPDSEGNYTVIINANLCHDAQQCALEHELLHIQQDHFCDISNICFAESQARAI